MAKPRKDGLTGFSVYASPEQVRILKEVAAKIGLSVSAFLRVTALKHTNRPEQS